MRILVINCGSSSVKYQFVDTETKEKLASGIAEMIGQEYSLFTYKNNKGYKLIKQKTQFDNHENAINECIKHLECKEHGVIKNRHEIEGVGHRVVHGGEEFSSSIKITDELIKVMKDLSFLAPLHNPANILGIEVCKKLFPETVQCGIFDTAFHHKMPKHAYLYPIPLNYYYQHKVKKYGFHGTSHRYVYKRICELLNKEPNSLKVVTCHLGNGASLCAIDMGRSIDTSMGLTPLEGLMMGTRCGDIDPALPLFLMDHLKLSSEEVNNVLNKKSGYYGITGGITDMRNIHDEITKGDEACQLALDMYCYRLKKYIASYIAVLNGVDALVFTGGVGENDEIVREHSIKNLDFVGLVLDTKLNIDLNRKEALISSKESRIPIYIVPTDEELLIALDSERIIKGQTIDF